MRSVCKLPKSGFAVAAIFILLALSVFSLRIKIHENLKGSSLRLTFYCHPPYQCLSAGRPQSTSSRIF
jgi:hypothetical protein